MSELKRCPFCGGEANIHEFGDFISIHSFIVSCKECGCKQASSISKEAVVEAWNTRKPMERIVERLEDSAKRCHYCEEEFKDSNVKVSLSEKWFGKTCSYKSAVEIVKEEGGLNE